MTEDEAEVWLAEWENPDKRAHAPLALKQEVRTAIFAGGTSDRWCRRQSRGYCTRRSGHTGRCAITAPRSGIKWVYPIESLLTTYLKQEAYR